MGFVMIFGMFNLFVLFGKPLRIVWMGRVLGGWSRSH